MLSSKDGVHVKGGREMLVVKIITLSLRALRLYTSSSNSSNSSKGGSGGGGGSTATPSTWFPRVLSLLRPWVGCEAVVTAFDVGTQGICFFLISDHF